MVNFKLRIQTESYHWFFFFFFFFFFVILDLFSAGWKDIKPQPAITCSWLTIETLEQGKKYVQK